MSDDDTSTELMALRCDGCGDTFTIHRGDDALCPSCGCERTQEAHEPLL